MDKEQPTITHTSASQLQVCVPFNWKDEQVKRFADEKQPLGLESGWTIRKEGNLKLTGMPERQACTSRIGFVHIMMDSPLC